MKIFVFILSLYIIALSIVPCADGIPQSFNHSDNKVSAAEHDSNHSDHQDNCTPFCVCVCCGSMVTLPTLQPLAQARIVITTDYFFHYTFDYSFAFSEGVWHPPSFS